MCLLKIWIARFLKFFRPPLSMELRNSLRLRYFWDSNSAILLTKKGFVTSRFSRRYSNYHKLSRGHGPEKYFQSFFSNRRSACLHKTRIICVRSPIVKISCLSVYQLMTAWQWQQTKFLFARVFLSYHFPLFFWIWFRHGVKVKIPD